MVASQILVKVKSGKTRKDPSGCCISFYELPIEFPQIGWHLLKGKKYRDVPGLMILQVSGEFNQKKLFMDTTTMLAINQVFWELYLHIKVS